MCGTSAINSLVLPKEKMKDMDKIRTGLAAFECRDKYFDAPFYFHKSLFPYLLQLSIIFGRHDRGRQNECIIHNDVVPVSLDCIFALQLAVFSLYHLRVGGFLPPHSLQEASAHKRE